MDERIMTFGKQRGARPHETGAGAGRFRYAPVLVALALAATAAGGWALAARGDGATPATGPHRIVSLNLCSDQMVLALADRDQIAGLTRNAIDPQMSAEAARAKGLPILRGSAEEIAAIDPDLVVGMGLSSSAALAALPGRHYRTLELDKTEDYPAIVASIRRVAAALGHRDRGEALIARMDRDLAALPKAGGGKVAAYYQRRGYMTGTGTLVDDLMHRVGLVNLAARLGKPALAQLSLEEMVAARPDYLIVESSTDTVRDQGTEMLHHPALRTMRRISLPQAWTVCGSPAYVRAARRMAEQLARR